MRRRTVGPLLVLFLATAWAALPQGSAQASSGDATRSQGACFRAARTFVDLPMPRPSVVTKTVVAHFDGTLTLEPAASAAPSVSPEATWATFGPQNAAGSSQLVLAYVTSSVPAELEPNGSLVPTYQHVLAWVAYRKHLPLDTATASAPLDPGVTQPKPRCTFVGQGLTAWDATTGNQILNSGFAPASGETLHLSVRPWTQLGSG